MARTRSEHARRQALAATVDLIVERGVWNLSIEEVAARSGVAKTTIYRHWPERASLIIDAVRSTIEHVGTPNTGAVRGDLQAYFNGLVKADYTGDKSRIMPCLIEAATRDPEIANLLDRLASERRAPVATIVERAQERGELPLDLAVDLAIDMIVGPIVFHKMMRRLQLDEDEIDERIDVAVSGLQSCSRLRTDATVAVPSTEADDAAPSRR